MLLWTLTSIALAADDAAPSGFNFKEMLANSGWVARGVLLVLFLMFCACMFVLFERLLAFYAAKTQSMQVAAAIVGPMRQGDVAGAKRIAADERFKASYLAALLKAGLTELEARPDAFGIGAAERAIGKQEALEMSKLKRGMTILATTGSTAPFVGLFGTTFGVINAFAGMASSGSGLASISKGISEALITTAFGIAVAVIGVWLYNYFNGRTEKVAEELQTAEADFMDWAEKLIHDRAEKAAGK